MPRIDFPSGLDGFANLPRTWRLLMNCFNTGTGAIISRPGIKALNTTSGVSRGQFIWNDHLYQIASHDLIKLTDTQTGAFEVIGEISGNERIISAVGFNEAVLVAQGGSIYTLDADDKLTDISTNPHIKPSIDVAFIDGRFVYIPADGSPAFFSDVGNAGSVQALSFFDGEELPDKNNCVFNFKNTLYIGGENSFELFKNTGASPNPFIRISGARINNGYIGGLIEYNETFLFIGRQKDQGFGIYAIGQGGAPRISNTAIDHILSSYTQEELMGAIGNRFKWRGFDIATFTLDRDAFGFVGGNWFILDSESAALPSPWSAGFINQLEGQYFCSYDNKIGRLSGVNADYGQPITRIIETGFEQENDDWMTCQSIELGISQGFEEKSEDEPSRSVAIMLSRDGVNYGNPLYRELGGLGQYKKHLEWNYPGGLGSYDGFMGLRIYTNQDVTFSCDHLIGNFR